MSRCVVDKTTAVWYPEWNTLAIKATWKMDWSCNGMVTYAVSLKKFPP